MRLYLTLTKNKTLIPFNYQHFLTGALHKWIGSYNKEHGELSLYSFSWLQNVSIEKNGINLKMGSYFFISAFDELLLKKIIKGIMNDPEVCCGSYVSDIQIKETPQFRVKEKFITASPIFIKRRIEDDKIDHVTFEDKKSSQYLTETMGSKLVKAGLSADNFNIQFDYTYPNPQDKVITYKNIRNRVSICPIIMEGTPEQIAFAYCVGIGNSTGIGFGALK